MIRFVIDFWLYTNFPAALPIVASAVTLSSSYILINLKFFWVYRVAIWIIIYCTSHVFMEPTIAVGKDRIQSGFALGIILSISGGFVAFLQSSVSQWTNVSFFTLSTFTLAFFVYASVKKVEVPAGAMNQDR